MATFYPYCTAANSTYLFVYDYDTSKILKFLLSDMSFVSATVVSPATDIYGMVADETHLYLADQTDPYRVAKYVISNMSLDIEITEYTIGVDTYPLAFPSYICADSTYLYVVDGNNIDRTVGNTLIKLLKSDLSGVIRAGGSGPGAGTLGFDSPGGVTTDGTNVFISDTNNNRIVKRLCSNLSYVEEVGETVGATTGTPTLVSGEVLITGGYMPQVGETIVFTPSSATGPVTYSSVGSVRFTITSGIPTWEDTITSAGHASTRSEDFAMWLYYSVPYTDLSGVFETLNMLQTHAQNAYFAGSNFLGLYSDAGSVLTVGMPIFPGIVAEPPAESDAIVQYVVGSGETGFNNPLGMINDGTYIYVADSSNNRIVKLSMSNLANEGEYVVGETGQPQDLALIGSTDAYIADTENYRMVRMLLDGMSYVSEFNSYAPGEGGGVIGGPRACSRPTFIMPGPLS